MASWRTRRGVTADNVDKGVATVVINFPTPLYVKAFTITNSAVTAASKVFAQQLAVGDEQEMDVLWCSTMAGAEQFTVYVHAHPGPVMGSYSLQYEVR